MLEGKCAGELGARMGLTMKHKQYYFRVMATISSGSLLSLDTSHFKASLFSLVKKSISDKNSPFILVLSITELGSLKCLFF